MLRKNCFLLSIIFLLMILLTGCWDYVEYEDMAQVYGMGVDYNPDSRQITITIQCIEAEKSSGAAQGGGSSTSSEKTGTTTPKSVVYSASDWTFGDALDKLQKGIDKRLFRGYTQVIIIGEAAGRYIMKDTLDGLDRTPLLRSTAYIFSSQDTAMNVLRTTNPLEKSPAAYYLDKLVNTLDQTDSAFPVSINDFIRMSMEEGLNPVVPLISRTELQNNEEVRLPSEGLKSVMPLDFLNGHLSIEKFAVFHKDTLRGYLEEEESGGLCWIVRKNGKAYLDLSPSQKTDTKNIIVIRVLSSKNNIKVNILDGKPDISINITAKAVLRKYFSNETRSYITPYVANIIEKEASKAIASQVEAALNKGQKELKTDIFGFGYALYKKNPRLWHREYEKKWDEIFPDIPVRINAEVKLTNTGTNIMKSE